MYDQAVFSDFAQNTPGVTTKQQIDVITNFVEFFGDLLDMNDGNIDTFVKDTHSTNNT